MITLLLRTVMVYAALHITLKILGKRQIGEMEVPELITTLLLSELATTCISDPTVPFAYSLLPILLIMTFELLISDVKNRSPLLKRMFEGSPGVLISRGVLDQKALRKMRISVEELLCAFRLQGIVSISDVYYAILEQNGQLSVILKQGKQQPSCEELGVLPREHGIAHAVIVDGCIKKEELHASGQTEAWLKRVLARERITAEEVFLLSVDDAGEVTCIPKEKKKS